jgi:hypothetical protein
MDEKKTWWERDGWMAVGGVLILLLVIGVVVNGQNNTTTPSTTNADETQAAAPSGSSTTANTSQGQVQAPQKNASQVSASSAQENAPQASDSATQGPPRNSDGTIVQLKITASAEYHNIAFTSQENYTNCSNSLTVITVDGNGQPTFTKYTDNFSTGINLFAGDQHSIAYGSLTDGNGDSLAADINSGMYGSNTAGSWGLTCDQGQYGLTINTIK